MKSWQAALTHIGLATAQAAVAVPFFNPNTPLGFLGNTYTQVGAQVGLSLLQAWVANKNSKTDPNGKPLVEMPEGKFVSVSSNK